MRWARTASGPIIRPPSEACWTTGTISFLPPMIPAASSRSTSPRWASGWRRPAPRFLASTRSASSCPRHWLACCPFGSSTTWSDATLESALALALNPISILTNRNVTIDSTLTLVLLLGAWTVLKAAETGRLRWLLLTALIVGIGFNIKTLEAYLVVPAYGLLYLLAAPQRLRKRIGHLALAGVLLLAISLSWVVAVDLTPASQRPYVGSTQDNSELSLALGYNGIQRLLGSFGGFGGGSSTSSTPGTPPNFGNGGPAELSGNGSGQQQPSGGPGGGGGVGGLF